MGNGSSTEITNESDIISIAGEKKNYLESSDSDITELNFIAKQTERKSSSESTYCMHIII